MERPDTHIDQSLPHDFPQKLQSNANTVLNYRQKPNHLAWSDAKWTYNGRWMPCVYWYLQFNL